MHTYTDRLKQECKMRMMSTANRQMQTDNRQPTTDSRQPEASNKRMSVWTGADQQADQQTDRQTDNEQMKQPTADSRQTDSLKHTHLNTCAAVHLNTKKEHVCIQTLKHQPRSILKIKLKNQKNDPNFFQKIFLQDFFKIFSKAL